ncbi:peptidoglycan-associated lipoprotein Pal [Paracraurococcus ruber]|uniref:Peptidoglycan-associated lipoprotein n=1 Tax=Paracraurococcus ruber TaxID=77675 RepID=A0ABS1CX60_9PROT|nr:peptidoglycan-associated lipoprotein Pal [Paracraurococcus ruber]MBK1658910.1 peptidoglycan-associated lipoprotein [Paracraurococcus ruber]TDG30849.1 peptidoglycan-associated lipoprotein Pal [Paracraurococcus ruber]
MKIAPAAILGLALLAAACSDSAEDAAATGNAAANAAGLSGSALSGGAGRGGSARPGSQEDLAQTAGDRVYFGTDSATVGADQRPTLQKQAQWLQQYRQVQVAVEGHADERGTREYNLALGQRRANAARDLLVGNGVAGQRIQTLSYGKDRPEALGSDEQAWAQNRRAVTAVR